MSVLALGLGTCGLSAAEPDDAFGEKVREYLLSNPEVILEVMDVLAERQEVIATSKMLQPYLPVLFETEMDLRMGPPDGSGIIVEFFDYNCAACRANMPAIEQFVAANPDVAVVKKHLPILSPSSERAARFVLAARLVFGDAAYQNLHKALYDKMGILSMARLAEVATGLGLDAEQIKPQMQHDEVTAVIDTHRDVAAALGVVGTPTFMSKRAILSGSVTAEGLAGMLLGS